MTFSSNMKKINRKIPGILLPAAKNENDGKITNLDNKSVVELLELRDRQLKLLNNKPFISRLPDKGEKIRSLYEKIVAALAAKEDEEQACKLLDRLSLNSVDKSSVQNIEWEGTGGSKNKNLLDSDDDSDPEDELHILSQSTALEKKVTILKPDKPLITPEDLLKIGENPHVQYLVKITETQPKQKPTGQFKPFKTTKTDVHNPEKEILRKKHKNWEVTAATPPPIVCGATKVLGLEESLNLQREHNVHLKKVEAQHAAEKLAARTGLRMGILANAAEFGSYREIPVESDESDAEGSDKEVHDEEPEIGGVVYTVMN